MTTQFRTLKQIPGPRGIPLLGNILDLKKGQFHSVIENWAKSYGPFYAIHLGRRPVLVISDNEVIQQLLRDRPDGLRRPARSSDMLIELGLFGVLTNEGTEWRNARKLVMRALTPEVIKRFYPTLVHMTERLRKKWDIAIQAGKPVDLQRDLKAYTLDATIALAMGQDINTLENPDNPLQRDIERIVFRIARRVSTPFPYWRYFKRHVDREADESAKRIEDAVRGFVNISRKLLQEFPERRTNPTNMLEALIAARDEANSEFSDEHVIGNAITMVFAGEDTTSTAMAWLINFLSADTESFRKLQCETDSILGVDTVLQNYKDLDKLIYIDAAATESMRLKPVLPITSLETNIPMRIGDAQVPEKTLLILCLRHSSNTSNMLTEPERFFPDRWITPESKLIEHTKKSLIPFGGGPRFCPGRYLAMTEIKMVMTMISRNFNLSRVDTNDEITEQFNFTMTPSILPARIESRS